MMEALSHTSKFDLNYSELLFAVMATHPKSYSDGYGTDTPKKKH